MKKWTTAAALLLAVSFTACGAAQPGESAPASEPESVISEPADSASQTAEQPAASADEAVDAAGKLMEQMVRLNADGDTNGLMALFDDATPEMTDTLVQYAEFVGNQYNQYDQHFVVPIAEYDGEFGIGFFHAICAGTYPDTSYQSESNILSVIKTEEGWKFLTQTSESLNEAMTQASVGEGFTDALKNGRNALTFGAPWAWLGPVVIQGNLTVETNDLYQNEQGDLILTLYVSNGTDENRSIDDIQVELTDSALGQIYSGAFEGTLLQVGASTRLQYTIPAAEVLTGTQTLSSVHADVDYNSR